MARVNVDSQALTDARFAVLASFMGAADPDFALGKMVRLWMQCLERETYVITQPVIVALFGGAVDAPEWLVNAELAERTGDGYRIKGTQGRIEYLAEQRARARLNGVKGGRPQKPTSVVGDNQHRGGKITPLTPALTPALKETPLPPDLDTPTFRGSWKAWQSHRREIKKPLRPTMISRQLKFLALLGHDRAVKCVEHTIEKGWIGLREPEANGQPQSVAASVRPATSFEMAHGCYNGQTGFERDAAGTIICDRLCKDLSCEHCKPRRGGGAS